MNANEELALQNTLLEEGGFAHLEGDPGGDTMKGVTQATYDGYRVKMNLPKQTVALISQSELVDIYGNEFWIPARCDALPSGVDAQHFDTAVNAGVEEAAKILQRSINAVIIKTPVRVDGVLGPTTMLAVATCNTVSLINEYARQRLVTYKMFGDWEKFGNGWTGRINRIKVRSLAIYTGAVARGLAIPQQPVQPVRSPASSGTSQGGLVTFFRSLWQRWFG